MTPKKAEFRIMATAANYGVSGFYHLYFFVFLF